jgi:protein-disulfide isomerase
MANEDKKAKKLRKWHQKWWGIIFLLLLSVGLLYVGMFIYQLVILVEAQTQINLQNPDFSSSASTGTIARSFIETKDDPFLGIEKADIVIVEFSDFQCPFSKEVYPTLKQISQEYQTSVKIIYRDIPNLTNHPDAANAALAADCAFEQKKFWEYHDLLFDNQADLSLVNLKQLAAKLNLNMAQFNQCLDSRQYLSEVQNDLQDGLQLGITGTPTFFINGAKVAGVIPYETFKLIIEKLKQDATGATNK